ncbi:LIC11966 family surface protein [Ferruginibacter sp. SUN106]|uniref:LIC11966 family surface protein n=1 Tax=Ferruginibacter sp. SUN106 TaxID=2978348 RepID=UPI003D3634C7
MKQLFTLIILLALSTVGFAQNFDNAGDYMSYIGKQQENISKKYLSYTSASAHGKKEKKVEALRNKLINEVDESRMNISGMPSFKNDKSYRDTAVNFMKLYYSVLNDDYSKIINMEEIAEQSYDDMEAYLLMQEKVNEKLEQGNEKMRLAEAAFAAKNNINLISQKDGLGEMMEQVHQMNVYYHQVYLLFFRPYKQEAYLLEAIQKGNITGIEQNKNALLKYAQEGLDKLTAIKPFQGDNSIAAACKTMLTFYVKEVNDKMGTISDFFLTKERFEKMKKDFEKKSDPSKDDVAAYNKGVVDINKASDAYNKNNQTLNQQRQEALNNWNATEKTFFDEHTPHYK